MAGKYENTINIAAFIQDDCRKGTDKIFEALTLRLAVNLTPLVRGLRANSE